MGDALKLEWNAGGWFGGQLGCTLWILVAALLTAFQDVRTGLVLATVFLVPNIVGLVLWNRRGKFSCYAATQLMIFLAGMFGVLAVYLLQHRSLWENIQRGGSVSATSAYVLLVAVVCVVMLVFYLRFGQDSKSNGV